ncbi:hypothetical protein [Alteromonas halophila]|uniref:Uncharacterized protein n=1 Tax=Alteromonas halophila TaxID=516698 RepID=A0A918JDQ1_9ALTE|nr:hypothetical protein [Alteromonas halophila]GGW75942.1 hypothetical protein GCM10007391_05450 [Alteromonas halophila]
MNFFFFFNYTMSLFILGSMSNLFSNDQRPLWLLLDAVLVIALTFYCFKVGRYPIVVNDRSLRINDYPVWHTFKLADVKALIVEHRKLTIQLENRTKTITFLLPIADVLPPELTKKVKVELRQPVNSRL